jgi:hypothetical protein
MVQLPETHLRTVKLNTPNVHKILQMALNISAFSNLKALQNLPKNWVWFENKPSGNPALDLNFFHSAGFG